MSGNTAFSELRSRVLNVIGTTDTEALADPLATRRLVESQTELFQRELMRDSATGYLPFSNPADIVERLIKEVGGVGTYVEQLLADPHVEEIYGVDGEIFVRLVGGKTQWPDSPATAEGVLAVVQRLVMASGESLDASHPKVDGIRVRLPDGRQARLSASIPPRIDARISFNLRIPQKRNTSLDDLVAYGSLTPGASGLLQTLMRVRRVRMLVAGPPSAGKTTLIEALLHAVPPKRRVICAEEQRELDAPLLNGEYWQTSKVEELADLIRSARVSSPELIVLGELKGSEAWELLMAGTLGIGVIAAVHAEDPAGAFEALAICATKAVPATPFHELELRFAAMFDVVIYCDIDDSETDVAIRQVTEIAVVPPQLATSGGGVAVTPIFRRGGIGAPMELCNLGVGPRLERRCSRVLGRYGMRLGDVLRGAEVMW